MSDKRCGENKDIHFMFKFFFLETRSVCEIMWNDMVQVVKPHMAI